VNLKVIASGFSNLLVKRIVGPFWLRRRQLAKTQWFDKLELQELQLKLLQRLISHCYNTVPYYRKLMDERSISVDSINTLEDIKQFPILTKQDVLKAGDSIISTKYPRWLLAKAFTGGTTGTPLTLRRDIFSIGNEHAFVRRQWDWAGVGFSDNCAYLKGRVIAQPNVKSERLYIYDPIMKELHLSTYHLTAETAKYYIEVMKKYKVKALVGYPSSVYPVARVCLDCGINFRLQSVLLTSETLIPPHKKTIIKAFNCKLFDFYGNAERVCYIFTCEHGNYHIVPEYGLTELIPAQDNEGGHCNIVATGFWNLTMPLIRYDTGDMVIKSDQTCMCQRAFPVIKSIIGRQGDVIKTPSGRELGASIVTHLVYVICGANYFVESQIIQDGLDHITIEYVPSSNFSEQYLEEFRIRLAKYLPGDLKFSLKKINAVQRTSSGKIKPIVSKIA
jgi:phenylacetate-CoA ligase